MASIRRNAVEIALNTPVVSLIPVATAPWEAHYLEQLDALRAAVRAFVGWAA
jgi:hypothetical protein